MEEGKVTDEIDLEPTIVDIEVRYVPKFCSYRLLYPFTCFFKVHGENREIPPLTSGQWTTLFACCYCGIVYAYDWELWPLSVSALQQDLNITEADIGYVGSAIRLGNILAFPITACGDFYGRKRAMLLASLLYVIFTAISGFAQTTIMFTLCQVLSRGFMAAQNTLSTTLIIEGLNAEDRGWGIGTFSAIGILGSASALIIFGIFGDYQGAWRGLFISSGLLFIPLICISYRMPESKRFMSHQETRRNEFQKIETIRATRIVDGREEAGIVVEASVDDKRKTTRIYCSRMTFCCIVSFLNGFSFAPSETFKIKNLIEVHNLGSSDIMVIQILTGLLAFASFTFAGSLSDRYGRKRFLIVFNTMCSAGVVVYFLTPGPFAYVANFIQMLAGFVLLTVKGAYFAELFPTSRRSSSQGIFVVCEYTAGALSLALVNPLHSIYGEIWTPCAILASPALFSGIFMGIFLPEVNSKDLDHVSPEIFASSPITETEPRSLEMSKYKVLSI